MLPLNAVNPFNNTFFEIAEGKYDLYGPLWINISIVFCLSASGNVN